MQTDEPQSIREARRIELLEERLAEFGQDFNSLEHARSTGRAHVVIMGDSHVGVVRAALQPEDTAPLIPHAWFDPVIVAGATARGLANPFSKTNAMTIFRRRIELAEPWQHIVFQIGDADCGFMIWFRATQGDIMEELEKSIENYVAFLDEIHAQGHENLIVMSSPATGGPKKLRRHGIEVSERDRADLTQRYNEEMERHAGAYTFVDTTTPTLDPATGLVMRSFIKPNDPHHLSHEPYAQLIAEKLGPLLIPPA
jgi:hypothetical protein